MEYNLGEVSKDMRGNWTACCGLLVMLVYIMVWITAVVASVGISVAVVWILAHFILNGFRF